MRLEIKKEDGQFTVYEGGIAATVFPNLEALTDYIMQQHTLAVSLFVALMAMQP